MDKLKIYTFSLCLVFLLISCGNQTQYDEKCYSNPKYYNKFDLPKNLNGYNTYELAYGCSKITKKPMAIYFRAKSCVNCKAFERKFLYTEGIIKLLNRYFVFAALSIDDKTELPTEDQILVKSKYSDNERKIRTIGQLNSSLVNKYEHSSQPSLFIASPTEEVISLIQYSPDSLNLKKQLEEAIEKVKSD